jgi:hypothetical protein
MVLLIILSLLFAAIVVLFSALLYYGIKHKTRWGINPKPADCPRCGQPFPRIRKPQNRRQALWGGATCAHCGTEVDKWGREIPPYS